MGNEAKLTAIVIKDEDTFISTRTCSTDLPQDVIGEVVTEVIQKAWRKGHDPVTFTVRLVME